MKVASLLEKSVQCKSENDALDLLDLLEDAFRFAEPFVNLTENNSSAVMENGRAYVEFELNKLISQHYITAIRPEIRDGKLSVLVSTVRMLDALGFQSSSWKTVDGMEHVIESSSDDDIDQLAVRAKDLAIENHAQLFKQAGLSGDRALQMAREFW